MMRIAAIFLATVLFTSAASAQAPEQTYVPPDQELWGLMVKAIGDISMPLTAHQQIQQIMQNVQQNAAMRAARKTAPAPQPNPAEVK